MLALVSMRYLILIPLEFKVPSRETQILKNFKFMFCSMTIKKYSVTPQPEEATSEVI